MGTKINTAPLYEKIETAEKTAIKDLARYKFSNFGYHAARWVTLNNLSAAMDLGRKGSPFKTLVKLARAIRSGKLEFVQTDTTATWTINAPREDWDFGRVKKPESSKTIMAYLD